MAEPTIEKLRRMIDDLSSDVRQLYFNDPEASILDLSETGQAVVGGTQIGNVRAEGLSMASTPTSRALAALERAERLKDNLFTGSEYIECDYSEADAINDCAALARDVLAMDAVIEAARFFADPSNWSNDTNSLRSDIVGFALIQPTLAALDKHIAETRVVKQSDTGDADG